ncbi:hypothetical protein P4G93_26285, partial [Bacillus cereus]|nr:hypothetical protein [Bacillus cereus]
ESLAAAANLFYNLYVPEFRLTRWTERKIQRTKNLMGLLAQTQLTLTRWIAVYSHPLEKGE